MEWENTAIGNLFVPDVLTPEQFYDSRKDDSNIRPVKKLMMAILEDALRCFQVVRCFIEPSQGGEKQTVSP